MLLPVRAYLRHFPIQRGKGYLLKYCLRPFLPPAGAEYEQALPGNGSIRLQYRETLGLSSLLYGTFENAELTFASRYLKPGDCAFDIGANVGVFSVVLGRATGSQGCVAAFEPVPTNVGRLKENLERNQLGHVQIKPIALGSSETELEIQLAKDAAYHSFGAVEKPFRSSDALTVRVRKLDDVWHEMGCPQVAFVKIDVEGAEIDVLNGGQALLTSCQPTVLIEANTPAHLECLKGYFSALGFVSVQPPTFAVHNFLFYAPPAKAKTLAALE